MKQALSFSIGKLLISLFLCALDWRKIDETWAHSTQRRIGKTSVIAEHTHTEGETFKLECVLNSTALPVEPIESLICFIWMSRWYLCEGSANWKCFCLFLQSLKRLVVLVNIIQTLMVQICFCLKCLEVDYLKCFCCSIGNFFWNHFEKRNV